MHCPSPRRAFWYAVDEDEATQDLHDVMTLKSPTKMLPEFMPSIDARCLSSTSTTATSPPPPSCCLSPDSLSPSPKRHVESPVLLVKEVEPTSPDCRPHCPPGALTKTSWLQARKVFVGGIPQTVDQACLYSMFSRLGKVKKAWLQMFHTDRTGKSSGKQHRGFGFVIFYEARAVDDLLGKDFAKFVTFDNLTFEVRRSIGKTNLKSIDAQASQTFERTENMNMVCSPSLPARQACSPEPAQTSPTSPTTFPAVSPIAFRLCQDAAAEAPQTWQAGSLSNAQAVIVGFTPCVAMPVVPSFPFLQSSDVQWHPNNTPPMMVPSSQAFPVLFDCFSSSKPHDNEKLTMALLEAMPAYYED